jgi:hypothetical protein
MNECQSCGKVGGKSVDFSYDGMIHGMWICPHCGPGSVETLRAWAEKRLDHNAAALSLFAGAFRQIEKIVSETSDANLGRLKAALRDEERGGQRP